MYKNGIPAEYLARQGFHAGSNNSSQNPNRPHANRGTWKRKPIARRETPSAVCLSGSLKKPQSNLHGIGPVPPRPVGEPIRQRI